MFDIKIGNFSDVDLKVIEEIEDKCLNGISLSFNEATYLLSYVCFQTRVILGKKNNQNIENNDFLNQCDTAQAIIVNYFRRLNIDCLPISTLKAITDEIIGHSLVIVLLEVDNHDKYFIVDPTYNQFFDEKHCKKDCYKIINNKVVTTPDPGYFVNRLGEREKKTIEEFLKLGFMELNEENGKIYGDSFYKTKVGITPDISAFLSMPGRVYIKGFLSGECDLSYDEKELKEMGLVLEPIVSLKEDIKKRAS